MKEMIDPRLLQQIEEAGDNEVEAMVCVKRSPGVADERGSAGPLVDRTVAKLQEQPSRLKFMPRLETVFIRGTARLIREILEQEEVSSASATDYKAERHCQTKLA